jgi:hypothetical protein
VSLQLIHHQENGIKKHARLLTHHFPQAENLLCVNGGFLIYRYWSSKVTLNFFPFDSTYTASIQSHYGNSFSQVLVFPIVTILGAAQQAFAFLNITH